MKKTIRALYHVWSQDYAKVAELGFNAVEVALGIADNGGGFDEVELKVRQAADHGLSAIVGLDWFNDEASFEFLRRLEGQSIMVVTDEPNMVSYGPDGYIRQGIITPAQVWFAKRKIKAVAPNCQFLAVIAPVNKPNSMFRLPWRRKSYRDYVHATDMIGVDYYKDSLGLAIHLPLHLSGIPRDTLVGIPAIRTPKQIREHNAIFNFYGIRHRFWYAADGDGDQWFQGGLFSHPELCEAIRRVNQNE